MFLNVLYYNCNSLSNKKHEFIELIRKCKVDVALVSETYLKSKHNPHFPGYDTLRFDAPDEQHGGGIAMLVKCGLKYQERRVPKTESFPYAIGIRVGIGANESMDIIGVYVPNTIANIKARDFSQLLRMNNRVLLGGDFNAQHPFWNCKSTNTRGRSLMHSVNQQNGRI